MLHNRMPGKSHYHNNIRRTEMKSQKVMALLLSISLSVSTCTPLGSIAALGAETGAAAQEAAVQEAAVQEEVSGAAITKYRGSKLKKNTRYYVRIVTRRKRNGVFCTVPMPASNTYIGSFIIK